MALGPEVSEAARKREEEERQRQLQEKQKQLQKKREADREAALQLVSLIAKYAEIEIDRLISIGCGTPSASAYMIQEASKKKTFFGKAEFRCTSHWVNFVIEHAPEELKKIMEDKYFPKGWSKVSVERGYIHLG